MKINHLFIYYFQFQTIVYIINLYNIIINPNSRLPRVKNYNYGKKWTIKTKLLDISFQDTMVFLCYTIYHACSEIIVENGAWTPLTVMQEIWRWIIWRVVIIKLPFIIKKSRSLESSHFGLWFLNNENYLYQLIKPILHPYPHYQYLLCAIPFALPVVPQGTLR